MKKLLAASIVSGMMMASFGANAGPNTDLTVYLTGSVTQSTCEPALMVDGDYSSNLVVNVDSIDAATATNSKAEGKVGTAKQFFILPSNDPSCITPTSAQMFIKGSPVGGAQSGSVLRNTAGDLQNLGMLLTHEGTDVKINELNDYPSSEVGANGGVAFEAQMYNIDGTEVTDRGTVSTPVTFVVTYQ